MKKAYLRIGMLLPALKSYEVHLSDCYCIIKMHRKSIRKNVQRIREPYYSKKCNGLCPAGLFFGIDYACCELCTGKAERTV